MTDKPDGHHPWLRIVVVTFNSGPHTQRCIDALAAQTDRGFETIIVDNLSTDGAVDALILPDSRFSLIRSETNDGFAGGSNRGLTGAQTPYVMTLNPDTVLKADCLAQLRTAIEVCGHPAMLSPILWRAGTSNRPLCDGAGDSLSIYGYPWRNGYDAPLDATALPQYAEVFGPSGAAALYRRDLFEAAGGFNADFFCYLEDIDLALRLRAHGGMCVLVRDASGTHVGGHSTGQISGFATYHTSRNVSHLIVGSLPVALVPIAASLHLLAFGWLQFRQRGTPVNPARARGLSHGIKRIGRALRARRKNRYPWGASLRIARRLAWNPKHVRRQPVLWWPLSTGKTER